MPNPPGVAEINDLLEETKAQRVPLSNEEADSKSPVVNAPSPSVGNQVPFPSSSSRPTALSARTRRAPVTLADLRKAKSHAKTFGYFRFDSSSAPRAPGNCFQTSTSERPFEVRMTDSTTPTSPRVPEVNDFEEISSEEEADSKSPVVNAALPSEGKRVPLPTSSSRPMALSARTRRAPVTLADLRKAKSHAKTFGYFRFDSSSASRAPANCRNSQNLSSPSLEKKFYLRGPPPSAWVRNTPEAPRSPARAIIPPCPSAASFHPSDESFVYKGPTPPCSLANLINPSDESFVCRGHSPPCPSAASIRPSNESFVYKRPTPPCSLANLINPSDESFVCQGHSPSGLPYQETAPTVLKRRKPPLSIAIQSPAPTSDELREFGGRSPSAFPPLLVGNSFGQRKRPISQVDSKNPVSHVDKCPLTALPPVNDRNHPSAPHNNPVVGSPNCETLNPQAGSEPSKRRRQVNYLDLTLDLDKHCEHDYEFDES